ncbi:MAG: tRNA lysidine(34) synthetase TilS [Armatimonadota bacterium]|nr:tRNA lysidine(34) synthetase TilS [Armatimonadota bacterium]
MRPGQLVSRVRATVRRYAMLTGGERVVVAVSGGPDSMALLHVLRRLRDEWRLRLHVAHVEHGLHRAGASHAAFVRKIAAAWDLPVSVRRVAVREAARRRRVSIEDAARALRYQALIRIARRVRASHVAVAHTADDQVETSLLWLLRGAGTPLAGMPAVRPLDGLRLVRPLIDVWRSEIMAYLASEGVPFRTDPTNRLRGPLRNRIRQDLLPHLTGYNPGVKAVLRRAADQAADDAALLDSLARQAARTTMRRTRGSVRLQTGRLRTLPVSLQRRVAREALIAAGGNVRGLAFVHVERLREMAASDQGRDRADLPGLCAERRDGVIIVRRARGRTLRRTLRRERP